MKYNELLNTNDVLNLLIKHLNFAPQQKGKSIFFLCPFHEDKTPSLSFEPTRKIFKCFACHFSARNIFEFWAKYKHGNREITPAELRQALVEISKLGYFSLAVWQEKEKAAEKTKNRINDLFSLVVDIYQHNLLTASGREILHYLRVQRQLNTKLINSFALGCSISNKQLTSLLFRLENNDFWSEDLLLTGLIQVNDRNQVYDYFSASQLILPLPNEKGEIVALAARKKEVEAGESKYNYLPNYQNYQKSSLLYNYSVVKQNRATECYLVEGFFDVISLTRLGYENCFAILGTSCSTVQIQLLRQLKKRIILFLDGDKAGREATINIALSLLTNEIDCEVIKPSYQSDPDEICCQHDQETVQNILQARQNPYLFILDHYFHQWEIKENPQRIARFIGEIVQLFAKFKENIHRFLIEKISVWTGWSQKEIATYFAPRHLPALHISNYWTKIIGEKENKLIALCADQRKFWLITASHNYFFASKNNREYYQNIYNYYISSPNNETFPKKYYNAFLTENQTPNPAQILREIAIIKQYIHQVNTHYV